MALVGTLALLVLSLDTSAQNAPLKVIVEGNTYAVEGAAESARFTARVLDEHGAIGAISTLESMIVDTLLSRHFTLRFDAQEDRDDLYRRALTV